MTWRSSLCTAFDFADHNNSLNIPYDYNNGNHIQNRNLALFAIAFLLFLPLFFQASSGVFKDTSVYFNSGGNFISLPMPISIITCSVGILILGGLTKTRLTISIFILTFLAMLASASLLSIAFGDLKKSKLILLAQYISPICALVLGQQYGNRPGAIKIMAKAFTLILLFAVPAQLTSTFMHGLTILSPSLLLFSAYQHLQYIPVIFVGAFLVSIFSLWQFKGYRLLLSILAGLMGIYVSLSLSMLAIGFLIIGLVCFSGYKLLSNEKGICACAMTLLTAFILSFSLSLTTPELARQKLGVETSSKTNESTSTTGQIESEANNATYSTPRNIAERAVYLKFYVAGIFESTSSVFLGHLEPPSRNSYPSAHNYYLDYIYNFGLIAIIPLLSLLGFTIYLVIQNSRTIFRSSEILGMTGVVLFLLLADNMLKVGMRQPYPGIMTFYLWGALLAILLRLDERPYRGTR